MTAIPKRLSDRPQSRSRPLRDVDGTAEVLRDALASLQLTGALFLRGEFSSPWAIESSRSEVLARALEPRARRVILFHVVIEGRLIVSVGGVDHELGPGDVAILPFADQHVMGSPEKASPIPIGQLFPPRPWSGLPSLHHGGGGATTSIACGYLYSDELCFSPILAAMPSLMVVRTGGGAFTDWLRTTVQFALAEADARRGGRDVLMQRLPELLFLKCVDLHARSDSAAAVGWLAAAADPIVGRAMAQMHRNPEQPWSLQKLSRTCSTSRSVLEERFHRLIGCPPMQYLTSCRLQLAARRLRATNQSVAEIASAVGYGAEASFSRAFKRHTGVSPTDWRRRSA
jgi:AraC-like DNA-binding protein